MEKVRFGNYGIFTLIDKAADKAAIVANGVVVFEYNGEDGSEDAFDAVVRTMIATAEAMGDSYSKIVVDDVLDIVPPTWTEIIKQLYIAFADDIPESYDHDDLFFIQPFIEDCQSKCITDYDGYGYYAAVVSGKMKVFNYVVDVEALSQFPDCDEKYLPPDFATHIVWYNR